MTRDREDEIDWRTLIRRIKAGKCTPIISYRVSANHFTEEDRIIEAWADDLDYPLSDPHNFIRVAQYASIISRDSLAAKEDFLEFLKRRLLDKVRAQPALEQNDFLDTLEDEMDDLAFSAMAARLGYPDYKNELENPLRILAELPLPIYLTTNYCTFMEDALKAAGKEPRTELCYWHEDLESEVRSVFDKDPNYEPSVAEPLVYHIHGLDAYPASLVLAEDDYMDFLVKISQDTEAIPHRVAQALADTSLMLLGYQLSGWDFKVIFRGLITSKRASRRLLSVSLQLSPEIEEIQDVKDARRYLKKYFESSNFDIYWGDTSSFAQELWEQWQQS